MSSSRAALKAIVDSVKQQNFDVALELAQGFVQREPKSYQASVTHPLPKAMHHSVTDTSSSLVLLALALDKTNRPDEAERTYQAATKLKPNDSQAWKGLVQLYEGWLSRKTLSSYQNAVVRLVEVLRDSDQAQKCQKTIDDFIAFARAHGSTDEYVDALRLTLPGSPVYSAVEGRTRPAETYETIANILEVYEKQQINTLIGERRTRIGAKVTEVTLEVKREVLGRSRLGHIYRELINWSDDDDVRRKYEEKLLQHCHDRLLVLPRGPEKSQELDTVLRLANEMVIIKHPFRLAWEININWKDLKETGECDALVLSDYCTFFPDSDLCRVITSYLGSEISPLPKPKTQQPKPPTNAGRPVDESEEDDYDDDDDDGGAPTNVVPLTDEDRLPIMLEATHTPSSLFACRLTTEYLEYLQEYESSVETIHKALGLLKDERERTGIGFNHTEAFFHLQLATALVFYQSPRHHDEAKALFKTVLDKDPESTKALIGMGLVFEEEEDYDEALKSLEHALQRDPHNLHVRSEAAWVKALKGDYERSAAELERCIPLMAAMGDTSKDLLAAAQYRLGCCKWNIDTCTEARRKRGPGSAYNCFLDSLRSNLNFAQSYTSLGVYYADYARDKKRARRCFQKAFELSASEIVSANRLALSFANEADWDGLELVCQRLVDSGKVKPAPGSKRKGTISWPFASLGVAQLHKREFHKAIASFQAALRLSPNDYHSWVGLGESYHHSGRYVSAVKAIQYAQRLEKETDTVGPDQTWFTNYLLANIKRELGDFDDAIELYRSITHDRPGDEGVAITLLETLADSAIDSLEKGLLGKSVMTAGDAIGLATKAPDSMKRNNFNLWKAVADSCSIFASVQGWLTDLPIENLRRLFEDGRDNNVEHEIWHDVDGVSSATFLADGGGLQGDERVSVDLRRALHGTLLAHKRAIYAAADDRRAQSVAFYNLGWAEQHAHICLPLPTDGLKRKKWSGYSKAAIMCFKRAIELEAGNSDFWNALGVVTSQANPAVAQHSFVRSLHLDERNVHSWTNLGCLGLLHGDAELAKDAFTRAQSTDPDYAHAWLGQGLVALAYGEVNDARSLFTHAVDMAEASSLISRQQYSLSVFDHVLNSAPGTNVTPLIQAMFALDQVQRLRPLSLNYSHLGMLFRERMHGSQVSRHCLEKTCTALEADYYKDAGSAQVLRSFPLALADLARSCLATGSYSQAVHCGEKALQLIGNDDSDNGLIATQRQRVRLSANLIVGLAHYFLNDASQAAVYLESTVQDSDDDPNAVCLVAQILWATGSEDAREQARSFLFDVVGNRPDHVQSVVLLGVMAILDQDQESLEAVVAELEVLQTSDKTTSAEQGQVKDILQAAAALAAPKANQNLRREAQTDIMLQPYLPRGWLDFGAWMDSDDDFSQEMAVKLACQSKPPRGDLAAEDVAKALWATGRVAHAQVGILLAPWMRDGWHRLVDMLCKQ